MRLLRNIALVAAASATLTTVLAAQNGHTHVGHVADRWRDTPENMGLLPTAQAEAEVAVQHAGLAARANNLAGIQRHIAHVMHALDPETQESGPGKGYGLIKAAQGAHQHIGLAGQAPDASDNLKRHAEHVRASAANAAEWGLAALEHCRSILETEDAERAAELAEGLSSLLDRIANGVDANEDGRIGWGPGEGGLAQAATHLGLLKRGEGLGG